MTLNQVIKRIKATVQAHLQIRSFYYGSAIGDLVSDHTTRYPSAFLIDITPGSLELSGKARSLGFQLFLLDLVNVSQDRKENEQDIMSDMLSVAEDIIAELNHNSFTDWKLNVSVPVTLVKDALPDVVAGVAVSFTIITPYEQDVCAVPTDSPIQIEDMKLVFDTKYTATGNEGSTLDIEELKGKKILFITREMAPLYPVSIDPQSSEYTWNGAVIGLGAPVGVGERFLILYRTF